MPSTRDGSPTPPGSRTGFQNGDGSEGMGYALPNGILSSNNSVAVTSTSSTPLNGEFSTPARGFHFSSFSETPNSARKRAVSESPRLNPLQKHEQDLEAGYQVQATQRMHHFLFRFPGGAPEHEINIFKQKEAVERTKFVVYKEAQLAKFIKQQHGINYDPYVSPETPLPPFGHRQSVAPCADQLTAFGRERDNNSKNPFIVTSFFPPPPPPANRSVNAFTFRSDTSLASYPMSSNSGVPDCASSDVNGGNDAQVKQANGASDLNNTINMPAQDTITREQLVTALSAMWEKIEAGNSETAKLRSEMTELREFIAVLTNGSDLADLARRLSLVEHKLQTYQNGAPLESDAALVANLEAEVKNLAEKVQVATADVLTRRAFQAENDLTKMTFNNKFALIEKYLGIDITTTGPKPHDVLEALHARMWHLEGFLAPDDPNFKAREQYRPLNDFLKVTLSRGNAMIGFSATPGYTNGAFGEPSPSYGSLGAATTNVYLPPRGRNSFSSTQRYGANPTPAQGVTPAANTIADLQDHLAGMQFDPSDIRYRGNPTSTDSGSGSTNGSTSTTAAQIKHVPRVPEQPPPRRMSATSLIPIGAVGSDAPRSRWDWKSPPRRSRDSSIRGSFTTSPTARRFTGFHSRTNSVNDKEALQDAIAGAAVTAPSVPALPAPATYAAAASVAPATATATTTAVQKTGGTKAYTSWLNQRPGDFLGKKLSGLGQKE